MDFFKTLKPWARIIAVIWTLYVVYYFLTAPRTSAAVNNRIGGGIVIWALIYFSICWLLPMMVLKLIGKKR